MKLLQVLRACGEAVCESESDWVGRWREFICFCVELQFILHSEEVQKVKSKKLKEMESFRNA